MADQFVATIENQHAAVELTIAAGNIFQPRAPISNREFFAGRWEQLTTVADAVNQKGLHIVIFGERGVGKTSLANVIEPLLIVMEESLTGKKTDPRLVVKVNTNQGDTFASVWGRVFDEVSWVENKPAVGLSQASVASRTTLRTAFNISDDPTIDEVRRALGLLKKSVIIFDEFDRGSAAIRMAFTDLIKALSDYAVDTTIVVVGVSDTVDHLIRDHASIVRAVVQINLPRMTEKELAEILANGSKALNIQFSPDAANLIIRMSQGLPHYTHLIGLHATREAANRMSRLIETEDVYHSLSKAVRQALQSIQEKYLAAVHSAHKDALYSKVVFACAVASSTAKDALGFFHPSDVVSPLGFTLGRENLQIATFQKHINELCKSERGSVLERNGYPRAYKYRFHDPLMTPYIFMTSVANGMIDIKKLKAVTGCS